MLKFLKDRYHATQRAFYSEPIAERLYTGPKAMQRALADAMRDQLMYAWS